MMKPYELESNKKGKLRRQERNKLKNIISCIQNKYCTFLFSFTRKAIYSAVSENIKQDMLIHNDQILQSFLSYIKVIFKKTFIFL